MPETILAALVAMTFQQIFRVTKQLTLVQIAFHNSSEAASLALPSLAAHQLLSG